MLFTKPQLNVTSGDLRDLSPVTGFMRRNQSSTSNEQSEKYVSINNEDRA